jgi:sulfatase modifying factor 1
MPPTPGICCAPNAGREDVTSGVDGFKRVHSGATENMVLLDGGTFLMGTDHPEGFPDDGEGPVREVHIDPIYIDKYAVTNSAFTQFVKATNYKTEAEEFGWSFVFWLFLPPYRVRQIQGKGETVMGLEWWCKVEGAYWRHPCGPQSNIKKLADLPVVHISYRDASAYCEWAGKRLPTEAEWECAGRGELEGKIYPWGDDLTPNGRHMCNIWQGKFPSDNTCEDGHAGPAPVFAYEPNTFGLYNMAGNVWEWCHDWWSPDFHVTGPHENPTGPPNGSKRRVMKGGSYLCHDSYCNRYRMGARTSNTPDSSTGNLGFRCVRDV